MNNYSKKFFNEMKQRRVYSGEKTASWLFEERLAKQKRSDTGRFLHLSIKENRKGMKSCIWFQYPYNGFYWHSKDAVWVRKIGEKLRIKRGITLPRGLAAIGKGVKRKYVERLKAVKFCGISVNVPADSGSCLDSWYRDWLSPRGGASKAQKHLFIKNWGNKSTWSVV